MRIIPYLIVGSCITLLDRGVVHLHMPVCDDIRMCTKSLSEKLDIPFIFPDAYS